MNKNTIEFVGMPGAGKSTIVDKIKDDENHLIGTDDLNKIWMQFNVLQKIKIVLYSFENIRLWIEILKNIPANVSCRNCIQRLLKIPIYEAFLKVNENSIVLDQGSLQNVWSIMVRNKRVRRSSIEKLICLLAQDKTIFLVDVNEGVLVERITSRTGHSLYDGNEENDIHIAIKNDQDFFYTIQLILKQTNANFYVINNNKEIETAYQNIQSLLVNETSVKNEN
jgi:adenylate kinase family enzyme